MLTLLKRLLSSIVDYAGLFPPAQLSLSEAMNVYDRARSSPHRWMLDRFVLPATRLQEFIKLLPHEETFVSQHWSLSMILSKNWEAELKQIEQITETRLYTNSSLRISALEVAPLSPIEIQQISINLPAEINTFFEIPFDADLAPYLNILQELRASAKLRTGGITSNAFPQSIELAQRILSLANAQIPFKATAGLHHPLHGYCLTPASNTKMHGFLNVAIVAAFAYQKAITLSEAVAILEESSIDAFQFSETEVSWHDRILSSSAIENSRQHCFRSFGSCSFQEPIDDLYDLNLL